MIGVLQNSHFDLVISAFVNDTRKFGSMPNEATLVLVALCVELGRFFFMVGSVCRVFSCLNHFLPWPKKHTYTHTHSKGSVIYTFLRLVLCMKSFCISLCVCVSVDLAFSFHSFCMFVVLVNFACLLVVNW